MRRGGDAAVPDPQHQPALAGHHAARRAARRRRRSAGRAPTGPCGPPQKRSRNRPRSRSANGARIEGRITAQAKASDHREDRLGQLQAEDPERDAEQHGGGHARCSIGTPSQRQGSRRPRGAQGGGHLGRAAWLGLGRRRRLGGGGLGRRRLSRLARGLRGRRRAPRLGCGRRRPAPWRRRRRGLAARSRRGRRCGFGRRRGSAAAPAAALRTRRRRLAGAADVGRLGASAAASASR